MKFVEFHVYSHPCGHGDFKGKATSARSIMFTGKRKNRAIGRDLKEWKMKKAGEKSKRLKKEEIRRQSRRDCRKWERQRQQWPV